MVTCFIKYVLDLGKLDQFKEYARIWISLVEKYGGIHHGYFLPGEDGDDLPEPSFSFPGIGKNGPDNIAVAIFSFSSVKEYENYRVQVAKDEECKKATELFDRSKCCLSYRVPVTD